MLRALSSLFFFAGLGFMVYALVIAPTQNRKSELQLSVLQRQAEINEIQRRISSLQTGSATFQFPKDLVWHFKSKNNAELALQDAALTLARQNRITPTIFRTATPDHQTQQETVAFELEAVGGLNNVFVFLDQIEAFRPGIAVGSLRIRPAPAYELEPSSDVQVFLRMTLWAFFGDLE